MKAPDAIEALARSAAAAAGIELTEAELPGVVEHLRRSAALAELLDEPLPDEVEPAPRFRP